MSEGIINLQERIKEKPILELVTSLTLDAILSKSENNRNKAIETLKSMYQESLKKGIIIDNQLFLITELNGETRHLYVCDCPIEYESLPVKPRSFAIE